ncbi:MAG: TetR/AcrR family transcriptional regulator [Hyphomonadaceae bacterium]|nr:TetR/AcrR family transcriptional regulator [Hyphomonadaceae bacterium]
MDEARARILDATVDVLRRHGPEKTRVVDVARALGMSHANIYRSFPSRDALFDAVTERWLGAITDALRPIAQDRAAPAPERLERWMLTLMALKRAKVHDDPELFAAYHALAEERRGVVEAHLAEMARQTAAIIADGAAAGAFAVTDASRAARLVLGAMTRYHHPMHVLEAGDADCSEEARQTLALVLAGLRAGAI